MSMNSNRSANLESEVLLTITRNEISFTNSHTIESNGAPEEAHSNNHEEPQLQDSILCLLWKNGKLGAAYYKASDKQLYVLQETIDLAPEFSVTRCLFHEVNPFHTVTIGSPCDPIVKCLINLANGEDDSTSTESIQTMTIPSNLSLLHIKECSFEACEYRIHSVNLPSEPENSTQTQRKVFLHSLIDFDFKMSIHALGALIKFTDKNWAQLNPNGNEELRFLHINQISLSDRLFMDRNTYTGLQIFQSRFHNARFKYGREGSSREGLSICKLLSQHCKSHLGFLYLRNILINPTKDMGELNKRLDFIQFAMAPINQAFIESLQDYIKQISDLNIILGKIQYSRANSREWKTLYETIYHTLLFHELCGPYRASSELLRCLDASVTTELYNLHHSIIKSLDFTQNIRRGRPVIKFGVDPELDAKALRKQDIAKNVTAAANFTVNQLPHFLNECLVVHVPEMGYMVGIKEWEPNCDRDQLQEFGLEFRFEVNGFLHYKNAMCLELDKQLGNIHLEVLQHEDRIIDRLTGIVLKYNKDIREPIKIISLIDCLISMSRVAKEKNYVRPHLNQENSHEIEDGRHPLAELLSTDFVPNDFYSGNNHSHMKLITGPNNSGKSIYLKQTALIIFLAHIGSYVPAKKANIGLVHSIHSRLHVMESAAAGLSAFMLDLSQMSQALHTAKNSSLVIIDEFGRGTTGDEGLALLVGALKKFCNQKEFCPHVLVSTHYQRICNLLTETRIVKHMKMDHMRSDTGNIVFLYKISEGVSNSYAFEAAAVAELDQDVINRAREIYQALYTNSNVPLENSALNTKLYLFDIDIPEPDD